MYEIVYTYLLHSWGTLGFKFQTWVCLNRHSYGVPLGPCLRESSFALEDLRTLWMSFFRNITFRCDNTHIIYIYNIYISIETVPTSEMFKTKATVLALNLTPRRTVGLRQVNTTRVETFVPKWSWTYVIYVYMIILNTTCLYRNNPKHPKRS